MKLLGKDLKIKYTKNYNMFTTLPMNRDIDSEHVQKLTKSLHKMGCVRCVITTTIDFIDGKLKTYIIDGQHLKEALERENMEVPYMNIDIKDEEQLIDTMAYLNNSSKPWDLNNYIYAWKSLRPDYQALFKYKNLFNLEITMVACICSNSTQVKFRTGSIKDGSFAIVNPDAQIMCKLFSDIFLKLGPVDRHVKFMFLSIFMKAYFISGYDHAKILANLNANIATVKLITDSQTTKTFIRQQIFNLP